MPGDGLISIGATFDKTNVDAGLGSVQEMVKASMEATSATIVEANAKSKAAWRGLSEEVKAGAATVTAEALKIAETGRAVAASQADLRRAFVLTRDATIPLSQSMAEVASAQTLLAANQAAAAAAVKANADSIAKAAKEAALSSNFIVRGFQKASIEVRESLTAIQEKLVQTAETGKLTGEGITAGFAGVGSLLGAGIAVGFATHFMDEIAKVNVELEHLAIKTGISITALAGLQQIMKEAGGDFEAVATGLVRMESNVEKLSEGGSKQLADAFTNLGLKIEDVRKASPAELLQMIASGMAKTADANVRANSAITIFGRGGQALIPVLREQGLLLSENMEKEGRLTGITDASAEAARRWTQDTARLSAQFRSVMIPVMEHAEDVIRVIAGTFEAAAAVIVSAFEGIATAIVSAFAPLYRFGALMADIFTGNFGALKSDAQTMVSAFTDTWKAGFATIKGNWAEVYKTFASRTALPSMPEQGDMKDGASSVGASAALKADVAELNALKINHRLTVEEERAFWAKKLSAAEEGSDLYIALQAKLAPLMQSKGTGPGSTRKDMAEDERELDALRRNHQLTVDEEVEFWRKKLAAEKGGVDEYVAILRKISQAQSKWTGPQTQTPDLSSANAEFIASLQEQVKETLTAVKQETEAYRDQAEEKIRLAHEDYVDVEKNANFEVEMGRMTAMQRLAVLRQAATQENQIRQQQMRFIQMLDQGNVKQYQADLKKEEQDTREFTRQIQQMHQQAALMIQKNWKKAFDVLNNDMITVMNDWIKGSKNMGQVFAKMLNDLIIQLADWVAKWLLHMAEKWAMEKIMAAMGIAAQKSTQAAANAATVTGDAGVAAANTMAYYTATDPPAAPAMAAAAFSATMAFMPAAAFDTGGMLQHMGAAVNLSGRPERVLDPRQTENFESMVNGGGGGGTVHNHLHYNGQVNAYDRNGMRQTLRAHADDLVSIIQDAWSSGKLHA